MIRGTTWVLCVLLLAVCWLIAPAEASLFGRQGRSIRQSASEARGGVFRGEGPLRFLRRREGRESRGPLRLFGQRATASES